MSLQLLFRKTLRQQFKITPEEEEQLVYAFVEDFQTIIRLNPQKLARAIDDALDLTYDSDSTLTLEWPCVMSFDMIGLKLNEIRKRNKNEGGKGKRSL